MLWTVGSFRLYKKEVLEDLMRSVKGRTYVFQMEVPPSPIPTRPDSRSLSLLSLSGPLSLSGLLSGNHQSQSEGVLCCRGADHLCRSPLRRLQIRTDRDCFIRSVGLPSFLALTLLCLMSPSLPASALQRIVEFVPRCLRALFGPNPFFILLSSQRPREAVAGRD
jgi:hypothetical protein